MKRTFVRPKVIEKSAVLTTEPIAQKVSSQSRSVLSKLSRLALLYAAEEQENLSIARLYRERILSGEVLPPMHASIPEERWVLHLGFRRLDEAWIDAELYRLTHRTKKAI